MTAALQSVRLIDLRLDGGTQSRAGIDPTVVERYAETVDELPPVDVFHDGTAYWLADGFHRVAALEARGRDLFPARVHQGTQRDAILHACGANAVHGLPRTHADARRAVERLLVDEEWRSKSDRWIATTCRVSPTWVGRIRTELGATAAVREYERNGVTHRMDLDARRERSEAPLSTVDSRTGDEDRFQAPEPDNVVRQRVEHEHQGAPLTEKMREGMRALYRSARDAAEEDAWGDDAVRRALADKYRVTRSVVDSVLGGTAEEGEKGEPSGSLVDAPEVKTVDDHCEFCGEFESECTCSSSTSPAPSPTAGARDIAQDQWWTPPALARRMVELAGVQPGDHVLEPSAGAGAIVEALLAAGATVEAHELDARWAQRLRERWATGGPETTCPVDVYEGDYLASAAPPASSDDVRAFSHAVINPPYRDGLDGLFLGRVLEEADVVVALVRVNALCGSGRYSTVWAKHAGRVRSIHPLVSRPDFTGAEESTSGAKSDFVVLVFGGEDLGESAPLRHLVERFGGEA